MTFRMLISPNLVAKIAKKLNIYLFYRKNNYLCTRFYIKQMEVKKSKEADLEQKRTQGFLLGVIVVLALLFVLLEWNSGDGGWSFFDDDDSLEAEVELSPLKRDKDEVPMMMPQEQKVEKLYLANWKFSFHLSFGSVSIVWILSLELDKS